MLLDGIKIDKVHISGLAALKIAKYSRDSPTRIATGQILGFDHEGILKVTDCFPLLGTCGTNSTLKKDNECFQAQMMRCLREINADDNCVGWYQYTSDHYQTLEIIETFLNYQTYMKPCICLIYNPQMAIHGALPFRSIRINKKIINLYTSGQPVQNMLSFEKLQKNSIHCGDIFEEIPIQVLKSPVLDAVIYSLREPRLIYESDLSVINFKARPILVKCFKTLIEAMDNLMDEQRRIIKYLFQMKKQKQFIINWQQRRRAENVVRKASGEQCLPEDDMPLLKHPREPYQLDHMLLNNQITTLCDQILDISSFDMQKNVL